MSGQQARQATGGAKAHHVYLVLKSAITGGEYVAGDSLPPELSIANRFGVSRATVRRALDALLSDGLVERPAGRRTGTARVLPSEPTQSIICADLATLLPHVRRMGEETTVRLLEFGYIPAPRSISSALGIDPETQVQRAVRVRSLEGQPFSHLTTHVPKSIAESYSEEDLATTPLFRLLERSGTQLDQATQTIQATLAGPEEAQALDVSPGASLLKLTRVLFERGGLGVEHLVALYRADRFCIEMRLTRSNTDTPGQWVPMIVPSTPGAGGGTTT